MMSAAVIEAARELLAARNYSSVVAVATHALEDDGLDTEMRLLRARALVALRRDDEAQADLRECLRLRTRCAVAYRLLGELCFRRDEYESARVFLVEAIRLEPGCQHSRDLLVIIDGFLQSTAAVEKLPAATAAVDCPSLSGSRVAKRPPRLANGTSTPQTPHQAHDHDLSASTEVDAWPVPSPGLESFAETEAGDSVTLADPIEAVDRHLYVGVREPTEGTFSQPDGPPTVPEKRNSRVAFGSEHDGEPTTPEKPRGPETFGMFLIRMGALTPGQLHSAFDLQRRRRISLAEAVIELGFATEPTIRTAGLAFRAERAQKR